MIDGSNFILTKTPTLKTIQIVKYSSVPFHVRTVKTVNFKSPKYIGDPINAVRIFNEKEVDELAFFDIDATILNKEPDYILIE